MFRLRHCLMIAIPLCALAGCVSQDEPLALAQVDAAGAGAQVVTIDGSSTVYPVSEAIAEEFQAGNPAARITIGVSGTGGGFKKFCRGELDIANASRPIQKAEMQACAAAGIRYFELPIAYDALTVVVHPANDSLNAISVEQLRRMWAPAAQGRLTRWNQVEPDWPDAELKLYGAGSDSGTFDYFTEAVVGQARSSRGDYTASEDDHTLVQGVAQDVGALGYFGYAYYSENRDKLKALAISEHAGEPGVLPSEEAVIDGRYRPLARPLFLYVSERSLDRPGPRAFVEFALAHAATLAREVRYVPLPEQAYATVREHLREGRLGSVFRGEPATSLTIGELLQREAGL